MEQSCALTIIGAGRAIEAWRRDLYFVAELQSHLAVVNVRASVVRLDHVVERIWICIWVKPIALPELSAFAFK
jgi:hypothetical protein